jgi:hypothetical protein
MGEAIVDWGTYGLDEKDPAPKLSGSGAGVSSETLLRVMR